jgi:hypothetical protein
MRSGHGRHRSVDRGSSALELCIGCGGWVLGLAVLAFAYQVQSGADDVADAAAQASRAASLTSAPGDAQQIARTTAVHRLLVGTCEPATVAVDTDVSTFRAGGSIQVTVSCRTDPPLGPARTLTATSEDVVDRYRGGL